MTIWFYLWLLLSAALVYFLGWTMLILQRQKSAWKAYALKKKLRYTSASMMASPAISGVVDDYSISLFTGEHMSADQRSARKLSAIEINLSSRMPFEMAVASGGMVEVVRGLNLKEEIQPEIASWDKSWAVVTATRPGAEAYLTPARLEALTGLMKTKNAWLIFICRADAMLLRLDTPAPLDKPQTVDTLVSAMIAAARLLEIRDGEDKLLEAAAARKTVQKKIVKVDEKEISGVDLRLEDEGTA